MFYIKLTFILLFCNIALIMGVPSEFIGDNALTNNNVFFEDTTINGETQYVVNSDIQEKTQDLSDADQQAGLLDSFLGILDSLKIIWDFVRTIVLIFGFSVLVASTLSNISPFLGLIVGIPLILAYIFALVGWIRSGN